MPVDWNSIFTVQATSMHHLKTWILLETQGLLDPADKSLDFVLMAIYRVLNTDFLLCYDSKFAFYINKFGQCSRNQFMLTWEEKPTGFAFHRPYLLAFLPSYLEIRQVETGLVSQIIPVITRNRYIIKHKPHHSRTRPRA
ncbi:CNH domain-containing protein [Mycena leptocephala]|nr:CNH domain-containing protein [Mycena leptocephala]